MASKSHTAEKTSSKLQRAHVLMAQAAKLAVRAKR